MIDAEDIQTREEQWFITADASDQLTDLARRPFDLEHGPLFRIHLLRQSDSDHVVLLVFHHIIADFLSAAVFLDDLGRAYGEERAGRPGTWPLPQSRHADFVRWQNEMLAGEQGERLWTYWQRQLAGPLPVLDLPTDRPRPALRSDRGRTRHDALEPALTEALVALGEANGASLYTTLLAAFQVLLARYAGQDDIIVGSPVAGRTRPGLEGLVGYFVNMLPMRANVADDPSFSKFLARVRGRLSKGWSTRTSPSA